MPPSLNTDLSLNQIKYLVPSSPVQITDSHISSNVSPALLFERRIWFIRKHYHSKVLVVITGLVIKCARLLGHSWVVPFEYIYRVNTLACIRSLICPLLNKHYIILLSKYDYVHLVHLCLLLYLKYSYTLHFRLLIHHLSRLLDLSNVYYNSIKYLNRYFRNVRNLVSGMHI